jgi:PAS domain-containing protein
MKMNVITITLPDERLLKLKEMAEIFGVTPEELVRLSVEDMLTRPDRAFEEATRKVLEKNAELYRRLA